jgi:hypothetical protein
MCLLGRWGWASKKVGDTILCGNATSPLKNAARREAKIVHFPFIIAKDGSAVDFQYYFKVLSVDMHGH